MKSGKSAGGSRVSRISGRGMESWPLPGKPNSLSFPSRETTSNYIHKMEVHAHTHTARKKWTHYLWEFLMLFLAVFCGFLAEYQLEHKVEKDRELQFIKSMITDLQDDGGQLQSVILEEREGIRQLDTLISLLNDPGLAKLQGDRLYFVARVGPRTQPFANNSRTFDQLRNSGGFRLIRKTEASNHIMGYYAEIAPIRLLEDNYNHEFDNFKHIAARILDPVIFRRQEGPGGQILRSDDNPALRTYDSELLKELAFHVVQMNGSRRSRLAMLEHLKLTSENLLKTLRDNYRLKS